MVRVVIPYHLQTLAQSGNEIELIIEGQVTRHSVIQALENRYPALRGAIIDQNTGKQRPLIRFFADKKDLTHESKDKPLPETVASGQEPFLIVGAIAGG